MKNKKILIYGLGTTGMSAIDALKDENKLYITTTTKRGRTCWKKSSPFTTARMWISS